jgi:hypothetical protein
LTPEYYQKNKEKIKAQIKARYLLKKEELLQYQKDYRKANRPKIQKRNKLKVQARREEAIKQLGGQCSSCRQSYPSCVYDFHHINPNEKEFTIGEHMGVAESRFYKEVGKCVLLCANCHRLEHYKESANEQL